MPAKLESLKIALRERINAVPDELFFIRPEKATSEDEVREYFRRQFEKQKLRERLLRELKKRIDSVDPGLAEFL